MNTTRRDFLKALGLGAAALAAPAWMPSAAAEKGKTPPNFVFILADDYGWRDTGFNGSTFYETPNLDRLAARGMRFSEGYAACPVCSPTRASIMTGKYPARLHLTDYIGGTRTGKLLPAPYLDHLPLEETTLAEALKEAGYTTQFIGKWHLGDAGYYPENQGFDGNVAGYQAGSPRSYFVPYQNPKLPDGPAGEYLTDRLTDEALKFLDARAKAPAPFLLYLSHYAVHNPKQGKKELADKFAAKAKEHPAIGPEFITDHDRQVRLVQNDPVYAAMVKSLDESVGRVMDKLDELGLAGNTVFIFMSDNGGLSTSEGTPTSNAPLRMGKGWVYEGGIREPMIVHWPGVTRPGSAWNEPVTSTDFYPTMLEMAGLAPRPAQHADGVSLVPILKNGKAPERKAIFWHYPHYGNQGGAPAGAVRAGDWKLIRWYEDGRQELYNIKQDTSERNNLAAQMPAKVTELAALFDGFLKETGAAMPSPNPNYDPNAPQQPAGKKKAGGKKKGQGKGKGKKKEVALVLDGDDD